MAKRSCRRTKDEAAIHDKAVKMRKMTDGQLVQYVEDRVEKARSEGFNQGRRIGEDMVAKARLEGFNQGKKAGEGHKADGFDLAEFIEGIGKLPGIGRATMEKIRAYAQEGGYKWIKQK